MKDDVLICGAGGLAREIRSLLSRDTKWNILGFLDKTDTTGHMIDDLPVLPESYLDQYSNKKIAIVFGMADPFIKERLFQSYKKMPNIYFPSIIAPTAVVEKSAVINEGVVVCDFCWISTNTSLGIGTFLNVGNVIGHDVKIGNFCSLMPSSNISGNVSIGDKTTIGAKSFILEKKSIGDGVLIGAGSCVFADVHDGGKVLCTPSHFFKRE